MRNMFPRVVVCLGLIIGFGGCLPTIYKYNENKLLEPDLVAISSTVIPLPIYKVTYGLKVITPQGQSVTKPKGPISLITVHTTQQRTEENGSLNDVSSVKKLSK